MKTVRIALIISLLLPSICWGQFSGKGNRYLRADFMSGFILQHKKQISHLITAHPVGFRFSLDRQSMGDQPWHQRYNYPEIGLSFIYIDYRNDIIGKSIALIPHYNLYLTKNENAKSRWKYQIGLGLGYNTAKYEKVENNKNNLLSTDFNFGIATQIIHDLRISERLKLSTSVALTHFSNGAIKKPNSGVNTISLNTGFTYRLAAEKYSYQQLEEEPVVKTIGYTATLSFGMHEATKIGAGSYPFFVVSGLVDKTLNHKSKLGLAVDWFYSSSLKNDVLYDPFLEAGEKPDFNRIGLALSHELCLGKFSVMSQAGYYVYDPYKPFASYYLRAGLRRYFKEKIYASLCVKSHNAKAEAAEFAIGWRFK